MLDDAMMYEDEKKKALMELLAKVFEMMESGESLEGPPAGLEEQEMPRSESEMMEEDALAGAGEEMGLPEGEGEAMEDEEEDFRDQIKQYMKNGSNGSKGKSVKAMSVVMKANPKKGKAKKGKY